MRSRLEISTLETTINSRPAAEGPPLRMQRRSS